MITIRAISHGTVYYYKADNDAAAQTLVEALNKVPGWLVESFTTSRENLPAWLDDFMDTVPIARS